MLDDTSLTPYFIAGFCCGLYLFGKGLLLYRKYRLLADTPEIPIAGAAMGLAEVHGKACGEPSLKSPVSGTPCFYYLVKVDGSKANADGNQTDWHVGTETKSSRFYLQDASGKILVDPAGAEFDLAEYSERVAGQMIGGEDAPGPVVIFGGDSEESYVAQTAPTEEELLEYVTRMTSIHSQKPQHEDNAHEISRVMYNFKEYCVVPGRSYDITGTCTENPNPRDTEDHNLLSRGENGATSLISSHSEKNLKENLRKRVAWFVYGGGALAVASLAVVLFINNWL